jgi:phenylpyruvate tautomerase PptA (4-oxalocrotonate tautomerase family)
MPLIKISTSAELPSPEKADALLKELSALLAKRFGKPEKYLMTSLAPRTRMTFGGSTAPACYVEIKNIGAISPETSSAISADVCARLSAALGVPADRIYIELADVPAHLWGWNGDTF